MRVELGEKRKIQLAGERLIEDDLVDQVALDSRFIRRDADRSGDFAGDL
jgi:hypothetical protein